MNHNRCFERSPMKWVREKEEEHRNERDLPPEQKAAAVRASDMEVVTTK